MITLWKHGKKHMWWWWWVQGIYRSLETHPCAKVLLGALKPHALQYWPFAPWLLIETLAIGSCVACIYGTVWCSIGVYLLLLLSDESVSLDYPYIFNLLMSFFCSFMVKVIWSIIQYTELGSYYKGTLCHFLLQMIHMNLLWRISIADVRFNFVGACLKYSYILCGGSTKIVRFSIFCIDLATQS